MSCWVVLPWKLPNKVSNEWTSYLRWHDWSLFGLLSEETPLRVWSWFLSTCRRNGSRQGKICVLTKGQSLQVRRSRSSRLHQHVRQSRRPCTRHSRSLALRQLWSLWSARRRPSTPVSLPVHWSQNCLHLSTLKTNQQTHQTAMENVCTQTIVNLTRNPVNPPQQHAGKWRRQWVRVRAHLPVEAGRRRDGTPDMACGADASVGQIRLSVGKYALCR